MMDIRSHQHTLIIGTDPELVVAAFREKFDIRHDELNPTSCLGLEWETSELGKTKVHNEKCIKESMSQIESSLGIKLKKENVPIHPKYHPELDESRLLTNKEIAEYQKFIGILQWTQSSLRLDIALTASSLVRYQCSPTENNRLAAIKMFGCLKKYPKRGMIVDSVEPIHIGERKPSNEISATRIANLMRKLTISFLSY